VQRPVPRPPRRTRPARQCASRPTSAHDLPLDAADAGELAELLEFLGDWLDGSDSTLLAASLQRFVGTTGDDLNELRTDLARSTFLLGADDGTRLFGHDRH